MKATFSCLLLAICLALVAGQETYTNKFDNVDVDMVLNNNRILKGYIKCLLEDTGCTAEGRELKKLLPDALMTDCTKCTAVQKKNSQKVLTHLRTKNAKEFDQLLKKFDPKGIYRARHNF